MWQYIRETIDALLMINRLQLESDRIDREENIFLPKMRKVGESWISKLFLKGDSGIF